MNVLMTPSLELAQQNAGGIAASVKKYHQFLPQFGVRFVEQDDLADLFLVHAGARTDTPADRPVVQRLTGLYWTADYEASDAEWNTNKYVVEAIRKATQVIVPSDWVAQTLRRDMHLNPQVIGHGVDVEEWNPHPHENYVLWNKTRTGDVCNPEPVNELARRFPKRLFLSTFADENPTPNIKTTGVVPHSQMKGMIEKSAVYLATTKETFGVGTLEAMASGVPILGFRHGMTADLVKHRENGFLADVGNYDQLAEGLVYCLRHRAQLGEASRQLAAQYTWHAVCAKVTGVLQRALAGFNDTSVTVVIPCYNYGDKLERAVQSALKQTHSPSEILIVDNNSTDNTKEVGLALARTHESVTYLNCPDQGVAHARNYGIARTDARYICCLDADDEIAPTFIERCVAALERDRSVGCAYTKILVVHADGSKSVSSWPDRYDYDRFVEGHNQVPTCSVFRRDIWERLGGYRQRYAPQGQGTEDGEFYLRMGAIGYGGVLATQEPLFFYSKTGRTHSPDYVAMPYHDKPWLLDGKHPFGSVATPRGFSHPVRQYDQPQVSVVVPVAPHHKKWLVDALDSVENQTFRRWELIVVTDRFVADETLRNAYPYAQFLHHPEVTGAGNCRNEGAAKAIAPLLLFLDADDWLEPTALADMVQAYQQEEKIVYSDGFLHTTMSEEEAKELDAKGVLVEHWRKTGETTYVRFAPEYEEARAKRQPDIYGDYYNWNWVSSLVPKRWHDAVGGFDWKMESWEDWDYWIRMARAGYDFFRLPLPLLHYRLKTGKRRHVGEAKHDQLATYMLKKYEQETVGGY